LSVYRKWAALRSLCPIGDADGLWGEAVVLSISKLSAGHARYYLHEAGDRVDVVESVGDGVEEYYVGGSEVRGEWLGAGARELGLTGLVEGESLRRVLDGEGDAGVPLRASPVPVSVAGYDLTLSAPKSVSVVFALGDMAAGKQCGRHTTARARGARVRGAHGGRGPAWCRRRTREPANGLVAAAFRHRTSRAGDPQLHTHVVVANLGRGPDGRWSTLDVRRLYGQARTTSFVYQAVLRSENPKTPPERGFLRADARTRTGDPFITSEVLYQLSYVGEIPANPTLLHAGREGSQAVHTAVLLRAVREPSPRKLRRETTRDLESRSIAAKCRGTPGCRAAIAPLAAIHRVAEPVLSGRRTGIMFFPFRRHASRALARSRGYTVGNIAAAMTRPSGQPPGPQPGKSRCAGSGVGSTARSKSSSLSSLAFTLDPRIGPLVGAGSFS
jgi:conjugative relaxase-like TrwC/TraI family protein